MFGGPTGIGALIVKEKGALKAGLVKPLSSGTYIGGGSVDIIGIGTITSMTHSLILDCT
jgi:hypothetical protein